MTGSTDTRFVTITHNPITMARINRLFGVTMAERGVSQLVSVSLSRSGGHPRPERGVTTFASFRGSRRGNPESRATSSRSSDAQLRIMVRDFVAPRDDGERK